MIDGPADAVPGGVAAMVRDRLGELSPAERKVARALLAAYPSAGLETVATLARRAEVSAPTVVRFATRLGFAGFPDLQRALRVEIDQREAFPLTRVAERRGRDRTDGDAFADVLVDAVARTLAELPADDVARAVALLADERRRVTVAGGRFSRLLGDYLVLHLAQLRSGVRSLPLAAVERAAAVHELGRRDVLVVLDLRRYEPWSTRLAERAAGRGATVVLLTDRWLSPVAAHAAAVLPAAVDSVSPYDSMVPVMAVVELLVERVVERLGPEAERRLAAFEATSQELDLL